MDSTGLVYGGGNSGVKEGESVARGWVVCDVTFRFELLVSYY